MNTHLSSGTGGARCQILIPTGSFRRTPPWRFRDDHLRLKNRLLSRLLHVARELLGLKFRHHRPQHWFQASVAERPIALPPETSGSRHANQALFKRRTVRSGNIAHPGCRVCTGLHCLADRDCDDHVRQAIASKIIELAKTGERKPDLLCERALEDIRQLQV